MEELIGAIASVLGDVIEIAVDAVDIPSFNSDNSNKCSNCEKPHDDCRCD